MLALLRKELRQNVSNLLALPGLAIAGGWAVTTLAAGQHRGMEYTNILEGAFGGGVTITCALVGLGFGLKQMLPETRVGQWAFLRHRPVAPTRLFFGKLLAALIYYALVVGIPLAGVIWWASTPGNFPGIWLWRMALPSLADFLCGSVYVLAGLFMAGREARWFGSRLLLLGFAILCSVMTWAPWWWAGYASIGVSWAVLLPVTAYSFSYRGRESQKGGVQRSLTAVTLLPAMIALPIFASVMLEAMLQQQRQYSTHNWYQVSGGDVYRAGHEGGRLVYRLIDDRGKLLAGAPAQERTGDGFTGTTLLIRDPEASPYLAHYRMASEFFMRVSSYRLGTRRANETWYYAKDGNYLFGYRTDHSAPALPLGYIGAGGFTTQRAQVKPFEARWQSLRYSPFAVVEAQRVWLPDLAARTCEVLFAPPAGELCFSAALMTENRDDRDRKERKILWAISTDKATYLLGEDWQVILRRAHELGPYSYVTPGLSLDKSTAGFLYAPEWNKTQIKQVFVRTTAAGDILARFDLPAVGGSWSKQSILSEALQSVAIPPGAVATDAAWEGKLTRKHLWCVPPLVVSLAVSVWLLRRYSASRGATLLWVLVTALLGLAGLLLMLAIRDWPPRVRCGRCGRRTIATGQACRQCGAAFAVPDPGEVAIFDAAAPQMAEA